MAIAVNIQISNRSSYPQVPDPSGSSRMVDWATAGYPYVVADGRTDDAPAWNAIFGLLTDIGKGVSPLRIHMDVVGISVVRSPIVIPRTSNAYRMRFEGLGRNLTSIRGIGLPEESAVIQWDPDPKTGSNSVNHFEWTSMRIVRSGSRGPVVRFPPSSIRDLDEPGPGFSFPNTALGRFENGLLRDLTFSRDRVSIEPVVDMRRCRFTRFENIHVFEGRSDLSDRWSGAGLTVHGGYNYIDGLAAPLEIEAPSTLIDYAGAHSTVRNLYQSGGTGAPPDFWFHHSTNLQIENLNSEGLRSSVGLQISGCSGIEISNAGLGGPEGGVNSVGVHFSNSSYCAMDGCLVSARRGRPAIEFDDRSNYNTIRSTMISGTDNRTGLDGSHVVDRGDGNRWSIRDQRRGAEEPIGLGGTILVDSS